MQNVLVRLASDGSRPHSGRLARTNHYDLMNVPPKRASRHRLMRSHSHALNARAALAAVATTYAVVLLAACGGSTSSNTEPGNRGPYAFTNIPAPPNGVAQFTVLPVPIKPGKTLTALGSLNPPGHTVPTDHVYFYGWDLAAGRLNGTDVNDVLAPTTGVVFSVIQPSPADYKISFRVTESFYYYLDHVILSQPLSVGQMIQAGTKIGVTAPGGTIDLGAFDQTVTNTGFVTPTRYGFQTLHCVSPWKYFTPDLQAQIHQHIYRAPGVTDLDGRIDFGIRGKLAGDWFLEGMPVDSSFGPYGWPRSLAFVYDYYDPSKVRISIGGTVAPAGVWGIDPEAPRPETVSAASGIVAYRLRNYFDVRPPYGLMLVQMVTDSTIKVQVFVGDTTTSRQFDAGAKTFVR